MKSAPFAVLAALGPLTCTKPIWRDTVAECFRRRVRDSESIRDGLTHIDLMNGDVIFMRTAGLRGRIP